MGVAGKIYAGILAIVLLAGILVGSHDAIPPWLVWLAGTAIALLVAMVGLIIFGQRILKCDCGAIEGDGEGSADDERVDRDSSSS